jgi:glycosyltransferase involved in cell wall biosynthesis
MPVRRPAEAPFGINIIGYVSGNLGLGVATRNTIRMLTGLGTPMALTDVDPGGKRRGHDGTYTPLPDDATAEERTPYQVTLFHMNAPGLADQLWLNKSWSALDRITATVPFWELPKLPESWLPMLDAIDLILAPTHFVEDAVRASLPEANVIYYRQTVFVPEDVPADRAKWGIPEDAFAFVSSFDISSDIERKNPEAVIDAFRQAFPDDENVALVLKVNSSAEARALFADRLEGLLAAATADPRIVLIDRVLDYIEVLSLYASSDVLVSLHRSEGLGLSLMEAMSLGKPVVTTGWSGNMDFTTEENSCLVGYDFIPVDSQHPSYSAEIIGEGIMWADPRVDEAAAHMRRLAEDREYAAALGARAKADMAATRAAYESGEIVEALRAAVAPGAPVWAKHARKRAQLTRITRGSLYRNVRRFGGRVLRRLGLRKPAE